MCKTGLGRNVTVVSRTGVSKPRCVEVVPDRLVITDAGRRGSIIQPAGRISPVGSDR